MNGLYKRLKNRELKKMANLGIFVKLFVPKSKSKDWEYISVIDYKTSLLQKSL